MDLAKQLILQTLKQEYLTTNGSNIFDHLDIHLTELGLSTLFSIYTVNQALYCHPQRKWYVWDKKRWKIDDKKAIVTFFKAALRWLLKHANNTDDDKERIKRIKFCLNAEQRNRINAVLDLAGSELPILPEELDRNPWLLNVENGTIDLKKLKFDDRHYPDQLITKLCPVEFDKDATCPRWDRFLQEIFDGDERKITFLQRAIGWSLTGDQKEHIFFILYGSGMNGKSTFLNTISALLNDYAMESSTSTLMAKRYEGVDSDVARLQGARFVSSFETGEGRHLNEALIKKLTGNDTVTARFLYSEPFQFKPEFKLWLATNHKPIIKGTDWAIWRRIRLIPFTIKISEEKRDKDLLDKLLGELPGILNWALAGCGDYQKDGLACPDEVKLATETYKSDMDELGEFLNDVCDIDADSRTPTRELYKVYTTWCDEMKEKPINSKLFSQKMLEKGFEREGHNWRSYMWKGLFLRENVRM